MRERIGVAAITIVVTLAALSMPVAATGVGDVGARGDEPCPSVRPRVVRDIAYVDERVSELQRLDLYVPERAKPCRLMPIVVWVHGGGWATGAKRGTAETKAALFNGLGYLFVSVNYRLSAPVGSPERPVHPDHADDVGAAVAWLEANAVGYGGDGRRIALLGHSSGAHLVALVGTDPAFVERAGGNVERIRCVGSYDTLSYDLLFKSRIGRAQVENAFGTDAAVWRDASPANHLTDRRTLPEFQVVVRGAPGRQRVERDFAASVRRAGGDASVLDAVGLTHNDVNRLIGAPGDTRMTPPVREFVTDCLGQSS